MVMCVLGIVPTPEDQALDGALDPACVPTGGAAVHIPLPVSKKAFERLTGLKTHHAMELYHKTQQVVVKCLECFSIKKLQNSSTIKGKGKIQVTSFASRRFVAKYLKTKGHILSSAELDLVMRSIDAQLEKLWLRR